MRHNSATLDIFSEVVKVKNNTELWDVQLAWYTPSALNAASESTYLDVPYLSYSLNF